MTLGAPERTNMSTQSAIPETKRLRERLEDRRSRELQKLTSLLQVSQALSGTLDLRPALHEVFDTLARHHEATGCLVVLSTGESPELHVEAAEGLGRTGHHSRYTVGEGAVGRVSETGRHVVVPRLSLESALTHQLGVRLTGHEERSFLCVPISIDRRPVGALGVCVTFNPDRNYERTTKFFGVVASMIGQAVKVQRLVAAQHRRLVTENARLKQELREGYDFSTIIGNSGPMQRVYEAVAQVARTNTTVLIRGESGTGKELVAQAIHYNSLRAKKPFIKVSCAALPDTLIESELFGYEKGAFTGAQDRRKGRFEVAQGGTLFLDEIGEVQLPTQVKLLRVLQEREFERLGGTDVVKVNVRLVAATNKDMEKAIAQGTFREDLFYRLNVFVIFIPPLRERKPDVLLLADHFLQQLRLGARQGHPAHLDAGDRHAHGVSLARQRARAAERDRAGRPGLRRAGRARAPSAAHAADRRGVRHGHERRARRGGLGLRAGPDPGRAQERARQPRQGGAPAAHDRPHLQLQGPRAGHRLEAFQGVAAARLVA